MLAIQVSKQKSHIKRNDLREGQSY